MSKSRTIISALGAALLLVACGRGGSGGADSTNLRWAPKASIRPRVRH
jgi:ABC-type glycerol-3-phosphate transport system substrate-binding protein